MLTQKIQTTRNFIDGQFMDSPIYRKLIMMLAYVSEKEARIM